MGTWKLINKDITHTIADQEKWVIPSDGLSEWTQYEISIYVDKQGNRAADLIHRDSDAIESGYHIPSGAVAVIGPVKVEDFPAIRASHNEITVHVSYAIVPDGGE